MQEVILEDNKVIVSRTDKKGVITYINDYFCEISGFSREELLGKPHNIIRHPDMPRVVFKIFWERLLNGQTIKAFVKNRCKDDNKYYWVTAFASPTMEKGNIKTLFSYRTKIPDFAKKEITEIYNILLDYEKTHTLRESEEFLNNFLKARNLTFDGMVNRLLEGKQVLNETLLQVNVEKFKFDHIFFKLSLINSVKFYKETPEVTPPTKCNFGKWIESVKHQKFANSKEFNDLIIVHNEIHKLLQDYVNTKDESLLQKVEDDTNILFNDLQKLIDKEEK